MLTKKKKLSKKQIKEDKLVVTYYKVLGYFQENKNRIIIYGLAFIAVVAAVFFYLQRKNDNDMKASAQLANVMDLYDKGSYLEAIQGKPGTNVDGLKKIVEDYSGTENGETAKIYLANSYFMLDKLDDAFKYYKDYSGSINIYKAASLAGQAGYYAYKNDFEKAASLYRQASKVSSEDVANPDYMLKAGINYIKAGKKDDAKDILEKIKKDYTSSTAYREVDKYLAQID